MGNVVVVALCCLCCSMMAITVADADATGGTGRLRRRTIRGQESSPTRQVRELQLGGGAKNIGSDNQKQQVVTTETASASKNLGTVVLSKVGPALATRKEKKQVNMPTIVKKMKKKLKKVKEVLEKKEKLDKVVAAASPPGKAGSKVPPMKEAPILTANTTPVSPTQNGPATQEKDEARQPNDKDKEEAPKGNNTPDAKKNKPGQPKDKDDAVDEEADEEDTSSEEDDEDQDEAAQGSQQLGTPNTEDVDDNATPEEAPKNTTPEEGPNTASAPTPEEPDVFDLTTPQTSLTVPAAPKPKPKPETTPNEVNVNTPTTTTNGKEEVETKNP